MSPVGEYYYLLAAWIMSGCGQRLGLRCTRLKSCIGSLSASFCLSSFVSHSKNKLRFYKKHYDWFKQVTWLGTSNQSALFQSRVVTLLWNLFMASFPWMINSLALNICFPKSDTLPIGGIGENNLLLLCQFEMASLRKNFCPVIDVIKLFLEEIWKF